MSWTDTSPPAGFVRYKVRRECLDTRYRLESLEVPEPSTGTAVSLVSSTADYDRVSLTWSVPTASVTAYRSEQHDLWTVLGSYEPNSQGQVTVTDSNVVPAHRYGYRLGIKSGDGELFAGETWIDVPAGPEFLLRRVFPNPSMGAFAVSFSLVSSAAAKLEVFDISGRRVTLRDVGPLGPGSHTVSLDTESGRLPAGTYAVRLTQGKHQATTKVSVLR